MYRDYKKSGGTLSFKEYIDREKTKGFVNFNGTVNVPVNKNLTDSVQDVLNRIHADGGLKTNADNKYIFGINRNVWIGAGVVSAVVIAIVIYKNHKK
jgi:hypothetical protein